MLFIAIKSKYKSCKYLILTLCPANPGPPTVPGRPLDPFGPFTQLFGPAHF